ncbi:MAG: hypothetical protein M3Y22_14455 [Pseudomonadota bacterium]|nr:hypothetical protein [Pseudomonadota bacterium]
MADPVQRIDRIGMATAEGRPPAYARLSAVASAGGPPSAPTLLADIDSIERIE